MSAVFDNLIGFTFTRMLRRNKLFICLRVYCSMSLFENFSSSILVQYFLHLNCTFYEDVVTVSHHGQVNV